jgi:putative ABC transport system substrate-binding protein
VGASNGAHILGTLVLGEEPSTASKADIGSSPLPGKVALRVADNRYEVRTYVLPAGESMRSLLSALAWTLLALMADVGAASAQQPGRVYRIGVLGAPPGPIEEWTWIFGVFRDALRDSGYVVGKNLVVDARSTQGDISRLPALAEALVATQPDVLVTGGTAPTVAAMRATKTIPIVFPGVGTPVERGIVKSLVNHGGNATGQAVNVSNPKMWQLLRDAAPTIRRVGFVAYAPNALAQDRSADGRTARWARYSAESAQVGFELVDLLVDSLAELEPKVAALADGGEAALFMSTDGTLFSWRAKIMEMATRHRLPTACSQWFGWGEAGCLITYGEEPDDIGRRAAAQVVKILKGINPVDIPIEQPTKFKLIVNAKTAKALDLTLPPSLLALADEVIE